MPWTKVPGIGAIVAFLAYAALSVAWSPVPLESVNTVWQCVLVAMGFALATQGDTRWLWRGAAAGMAVNSAVVLAQLFGWDGVAQAGPGAMPAGLFVNSNVLGWTAAVVFAWAYGRREWIAAAAVVPCFLCWFLVPRPDGVELVVGNITSAIAVVCALAPLSVRSTRLWWMWGIALATVAAAALLAKSPHLHERFDYVLYTVRNLEWFGFGAGSWPAEYPRIAQLPIFEWRPEHAHADFIEALAEYGLGVLLLLPAGWRLLRGWGTGACAGERASLVAFGVCALAGFPAHEPATAFLAASAAGALCRAGCVVREYAYRGTGEYCTASLYGRGAVVPVRASSNVGMGV
jgi:hypothetical protein